MSTLGYKHTEEAKRKTREARIGRKHTEETKRKISLSLIGNKHTLGYKHTEETKKKIREARLGKKRTEETKRKISKAMMDRKRPLYGKNNPNWKGGISRSRGYVYILISRNPRRYKKRARLIAEGALGRELKSNETAHHVNQIRSDDRNENLLICSWGYHTWLHNKLRRRI